MIRIVTDKELIRKYQSKFKSKLTDSFDEKIKCWIGYHGGGWEDTVSYTSRFNLWTSNFEHEEKWINIFGIGQPVEGKGVPITGQINFPFEGINRRVAGAFAIDGNNNILILHRGKIGGGKPGIGKNLFNDNFRGEFITAIDGNRETRFCLIGELDSPYLYRQISDFIDEIERIKSLNEYQSSSEIDLVPDFCFTDEHSGVIVTEKKEPTIINRIHGIVVKSLSRELLKRKFSIGNDKNRDLFTYDGKKMTSIFEVKTNSSTQSIYSAVGQLLIYSIPFVDKVKLIAVFPNRLNEKVEEKLEELGIKLLYYSWDNDEPNFYELDKML